MVSSPALPFLDALSRSPVLHPQRGQRKGPQGQCQAVGRSPQTLSDVSQCNSARGRFEIKADLDQILESRGGLGWGGP